MKRLDILEAAINCVIRDRAATHGDAENGFAAIAMLWDALDQARGDRPRAPHDVALYMAGLKLVRAVSNPAHADNWVDLAGYAACGGEIAAGGSTEPRSAPGFHTDSADQSASDHRSGGDPAATGPVAGRSAPEPVPAEVTFRPAAGAKKKGLHQVSLASAPWEATT